MKRITSMPYWLAVAGLMLTAGQAQAFFMFVTDLGANYQSYLQNEKLARMIVNQQTQIEQGEKQLLKLSTNDVATLLGNMKQIDDTARQFKEGIGTGKAFLSRYKTLFPDYTVSDKGISIDEMNKKLNEWSRLLNQNTLDTLRLSEQVLASLPDDQAALNRVISQSQNAQGILQAVQAGNQALGLITQQLIKINTQLPVYNQADLFFKQKVQAEADMIRQTREHSSNDKEAPAKPLTTTPDQKAPPKPGEATKPDAAKPATPEPAKPDAPKTDKPAGGGVDIKIDIDDKGQVKVSGGGGGAKVDIGAGPKGVSTGVGVGDIKHSTSVGKDGVSTGTDVGGIKTSTSVGKDGVSVGVGVGGDAKKADASGGAAKKPDASASAATTQ